MLISKKKRTQLYDTVREEIMQARIKIWKMRDKKNVSIAEIDDILSQLVKDAPRKAIELFRELPEIRD